MACARARWRSRSCLGPSAPPHWRPPFTIVPGRWRFTAIESGQAAPLTGGTAVTVHGHGLRGRYGSARRRCAADRPRRRQRYASRAGKNHRRQSTGFPGPCGAPRPRRGGNWPRRSASTEPFEFLRIDPQRGFEFAGHTVVTAYGRGFDVPAPVCDIAGRPATRDSASEMARCSAVEPRPAKMAWVDLALDHWATAPPTSSAAYTYYDPRIITGGAWGRSGRWFGQRRRCSIRTPGNPFGPNVSVQARPARGSALPAPRPTPTAWARSAPSIWAGPQTVTIGAPQTEFRGHTWTSNARKPDRLRARPYPPEALPRTRPGATMPDRPRHRRPVQRPRLSLQVDARYPVTPSGVAVGQRSSPTASRASFWGDIRRRYGPRRSRTAFVSHDGGPVSRIAVLRSGPVAVYGPPSAIFNASTQQFRSRV